MTDYIKIVNYAIKDALNTGDPAKIIRGTEFNVEFQAIEDAMGTKADAHDGVHTGDTTFQNIAVSNTMEIGGSTFTGNTTYTGDITYTGDVTVTGDLTVGGSSINSIIQGTGALNRPYRYWRLTAMDTAGDTAMFLDEIRLRLTGTTVQQNATVGVVYLDTEVSTGETARLNDGSVGASGFSLSQGDLPTAQIIWDFGNGTPQALSDISQYHRPAAGTEGLSQYTVSAGDDKESWVTIASFTGLTPPDNAYESPNYLFALGEAPADGTIYGRKDRAWVPAGGVGLFEFDYVVKTANFTAEVGKWHFVNTFSGIVLITPPASPSQGDVFGVSSVSAWQSGTATYGAGITFDLFGGNSDMFLPLYMGLDTGEAGHFSFSFIYLNESLGWVPLYGMSGPQPLYVGVE